MGRWGETGVPRENHLTHPQAELGLSHIFLHFQPQVIVVEIIRPHAVHLPVVALHGVSINFLLPLL